ncbi:MAG: MFS transporter [Proteobacteria bacterium]|nr:MFS transporter [Pseudomonadota bacterium]
MDKLLPATKDRIARGRWIDSPYYMLAVLSLVSASQIIDRMLLSIAVEPMKHDLGLSDAQLGFLNGTAFGLSYALAAIPLAALSDRWNRKDVIALTLTVWSIFTAATAIAGNFFTLSAARILVGAGEAGSGPAFFSLIANRFPEAKRAGAIAVVGAVTAAGSFAALWSGGYIVDHYGWRSLFLVFGIPGLILALFIFLTFTEPTHTRAVNLRSQLTFSEMVRVFLRAPVINLFLATFWSGLSATAVLGWGPAFLARTFAMSTTDIGFWIGLTGGLSGIVGTLAGGYVSNVLEQRFPHKGGLLLAIAALAVNVPAAIGFFLAASEPLSLALLIIWAISSGLPVAPLSAQMLTFMPKRSQVTAIAVWSTGTLLVSSLSATVMGFVSDAAIGHGVKNGLQFALIGAASLCALSIFHLYYLLRYRKPIDPNLDRILNA